MSWYDVSVGPNLATYNHVRQPDPAIANQQYAVIAPTSLLVKGDGIRSSASGASAMRVWTTNADRRFDFFLKGEKNGLLDTLPKSATTR
jgi:hypothetical protein